MAYPSFPQYPGSETGLPAVPPAPPVPSSVRNAFFCMIAGAAWQVVSVVVAVTQVGSIKSELRTKFPDDTPDKINSLANAAVVFVVVAALIGAALWIWMAFANRSGKNWARITGTVFFGISTLSVISDLAGAGAGSSGTKPTAGELVVAVIGWLIGLAAVILLWSKASGPYFKQRGNPYAAAPYPMAPPQPGQPYLGQQPPSETPQQYPQQYPQNPPPPQ